jgi:DNA-binding response OmpR family regulator
LLQELQDFIYTVFADFPETRVRVGPLRSRDAALRHIQAHRSDNRILLWWNEDQDMVNMFSFCLGEHGFLMESVGSFDACLESCMSRPPILLIINRSGNWPNDGLEHIRRIRSHPAISYFPIIMGQADLGLLGKERGYQEAFEAGANACFGQVFDIANVLALVKRLIDHPAATGLWDR